MEMLTDKVALITGGSSGIGAETARVFAKHGAKVAIFARGREKLDQVAAELKALGAECLTITGDVTKSEDCNAAIDRVVTAFGRIDVLVNNAGAGRFPYHHGKVQRRVLGSDDCAESVLGAVLLPCRASPYADLKAAVPLSISPPLRGSMVTPESAIPPPRPP